MSGDLENLQSVPAEDWTDLRRRLRANFSAEWPVGAASQAAQPATAEWLVFQPGAVYSTWLARDCSCVTVSSQPRKLRL